MFPTYITKNKITWDKTLKELKEVLKDERNTLYSCPGRTNIVRKAVSFKVPTDAELSP